MKPIRFLISYVFLIGKNLSRNVVERSTHAMTKLLGNIDYHCFAIPFRVFGKSLSKTRSRFFMSLIESITVRNSHS